jgi:2-oxoglutarate ferredoxin oxidoreductase subunit alpha
MLIMAAATPVDCFYAAFEISKLSMEHMTPAILLTEGYLGFGSELFRIPSMKDLPEIKPPYADPSKPYKPYERDPETLARFWAIPGTPGLRHRIGGLEKTNVDGFVSTDPLNHELMVRLREEKVMKIADYIPKQEVYGDDQDEVLVVSWGSTLGVVRKAVEEARAEGQKVSHTHFRYIYPLPKNTEELLGKYKKVIVCELNRGQFVKYLRSTYPQIQLSQYNKVQGQPFNIKELREQFNTTDKGEIVMEQGPIQNTIGRAAGKLTKEDFISDQMVKWCPGCGAHFILNAVEKVFPEIGYKPENFTIVSGIGAHQDFHIM